MADFQTYPEKRRPFKLLSSLLTAVRLKFALRDRVRTVSVALNIGKYKIKRNYIMKNVTYKEDIELIPRIFKFTDVKSIPISFTYGERRISGIPEDFKTEVTRIPVDCNINLYRISARDDNGLEIVVEYKEYKDYAATEWLAFFTNRGTENTEIISDIRIVDGIIEGEGSVLWHGIGDTCRDNGYNWECSSLNEPLVKRTNDGTSCNGAFPYMRLMNKDFGVNIAVGWTGKWCAEFSPAENGTIIKIGQERCRMRIRPGETIRTPRANFLAFKGDERRGANMWRKWYFAHILPKENGRPISPKCCMHLFGEGGFPEFTGATEEGQIKAIENYVKGGVRPDVLWMDAGWYPCNHDWYGGVGNWRPDPERFPNGLAPVGKKCAENGISFLLWFEPERVVTGSELEREHPEWMLRIRNEDGTPRSSLCLLNWSDPQCLDYITEKVDGIIKDSGVNIYRQDFNFDPAPYWAENEGEDREGALENLHIQAYYKFWDDLLERNPGLWIDSCASGGRRNDLETMRRAVPLHYTDVGYGNHPIKQIQHSRMFDWIPYFRAHTQNWDDPKTGEYNVSRPADKYAFYVALTPALTDTLFHEDSEDMYALSRLMQPIWRRCAELMLSCDYYPLTECRKSRDDFYAMAFYSPENGNGFLNVVSNNNNSERIFDAKLDMLEADSVYRLTEAESGETKEYSGTELINGFKTELSPRSGIVYFIERKQ
ncbi:MAG: alpha-galactosidase [Ruminococcaceae bacterium]|nr:alpha-galactosidase [Oscillospiraceae bacterium]